VGVRLLTTNEPSSDRAIRPIEDSTLSTLDQELKRGAPPGDDQMPGNNERFAACCR